VLPQQAEEEQAGDGGGDAPPVARVAEVVDDRSVDSSVVEAVPGGPDDRRDPCPPQVQLGQAARLREDRDLFCAATRN
jgi:hypothetical protein